MDDKQQKLLATTGDAHAGAAHTGKQLWDGRGRRLVRWTGLLMVVSGVTVFLATSKMDSMGVPAASDVKSYTEVAPAVSNLYNHAGRCPGDRPHELLFAVKQPKQKDLEEIVFQLADPESPNFRQWLTWEEVHRITRNEEGLQATKRMLLALGHALSIVHETSGGDFVRARAPVALWEQLLDAEFHLYRHVSGGDAKAHASRFTIPEQLREHVDGIIGVADLYDMPTEGRRINARTRANMSIALQSIIIERDLVTPLRLREAYNMPSMARSGSLAARNQLRTSQAVFSSLQQWWSPDDLRIFADEFGFRPGPVKQIDGGASDSSSVQCKRYPDSCMECNLDMQYMMAMSPLAKMELYYTNANFLDFVQHLTNMRKPPHVISISYAGPEITRSKSLINSFNTVAGKLAAQGVTLIASSGDSGANGVEPFLREASQATCREILDEFGLVPLWPASSPWVTAVGATMGIESGSPEIACAVDAKGPAASRSAFPPGITSGGGFSRQISKPFWQEGLHNHRFRGIPDVSVAGHGYAIVDAGGWTAEDGTSASAPVFAGMVSLINAEIDSKGGAEQLDLAASSSSSCARETGGTCRIFGCESSRGPTECVGGACLCKAGNCNDGHGHCKPSKGGTIRECRLNTGGTCYIFGCHDWRGPTECLGHHCICKVGFCAEEDTGKCMRARTPGRLKSVGWLNPLLYKHKDAFHDITAGDNKCGGPDGKCCGGYDATTGWDPVTGLGTPNFNKLFSALVR